MKNSRFIWVGGSALPLSLLVILVPWYPLQLSAGLLLLALGPGYALLMALWPSDSALNDPERWLIAAPISFSLTITYLLLLVLAHWPLNGVTVAGGLGGLTLLFTLIAWWRMGRMANGRKAWRMASGAGQVSSVKFQVSNTSPSIHYPLSTIHYLLSSIFYLLSSPFLILLIAAFFRLVNIHYSDYQGDEADILWRAISLVYGQTEAILTHSKGPGEILLLNAIGSLTGRFDEQTARLPFALAGVISIGLLAWLGQQLFNRWVGWVAGLLAAIDGVFVSYARTAQYQSLVLLLTLAALYCFYRFYQSEGQSRRWHGLGAFLLAASCLFHFETILLLPVVVYLTLTPVMRRSNGDAMRRGTEAQIKNYASRLTPHASRLTPHVSRLISLWPSLLIFITLVAAFYVPFVLHPNIKNTGAYLENRVSGGGSAPPFNNLAHFFYYEALKYNSAYYVILFNALLVSVVVATLAGELRSSPSGRLRTGAGGKFLPRTPPPLLLSSLVVVLTL